MTMDDQNAIAGAEHGVLAGTPSPTDVFRLASISFQCGTVLELPSTGVIVLVGPNNVGKTTTIGELIQWVHSGVLSHNNRPATLLSDVSMVAAGQEGVENWLGQFESAFLPSPLQPSLRTFRNWGARIQLTREELASRVGMPMHRGQIAPFLMCTGGMAAFDGTAPNYYSDTEHSDGGNRQFEDLYNDRTIEERISALSMSIFGTPVSLNRAGSRSSLHFGQLPEMDQAPTPDQREALQKTPKVAEQGLGVSTFLQLAITLELGQEPLVLLDEPDAHLHPPQAYRAGKFIAERGRRSQVFVVTHSLEFLHGILDSGVDVTVVRLDRRAGVGSTHVLEAGKLSALWSDTATRYSGVLAGLMHQGVVLCEGPGDCRYFAVALDHLRASEPSHDLCFVDAGGKAGIKKLASAVSAISTPLSCVVDFDFVRNFGEVRALVEALGADAGSLRDDWMEVHNHLNPIGDTRTTDDVLRSLQHLLGEESRPYDATLRRQLESAIGVDDGWSRAKRFGLAAIDGGAHEAAKRLLAKLAQLGVHVLPWGELEGLHPALRALHGPAFASQAIEEGLYKELNGDQQTFVRSLTHTHQASRAT